MKACFRNFFIVKICCLITVRFYFAFQKTFILDRFVIKFFFDNRTVLIWNSIVFFQSVIIYNQKIHPFSLTIITFYIRTRFWKHYMQWLNFIIVIQVTNKVFIVFFIRRNLVRYLFLYLFQFFNQHHPNGKKNSYKLTITLYKLNQIQLCQKPIIIYQYDSESTTQFMF